MLGRSCSPPSKAAGLLCLERGQQLSCLKYMQCTFCLCKRCNEVLFWNRNKKGSEYLRDNVKVGFLWQHRLLPWTFSLSLGRSSLQLLGRVTLLPAKVEGQGRTERLVQAVGSPRAGRGKLLGFSSLYSNRQKRFTTSSSEPSSAS